MKYKDIKIKTDRPEVADDLLLQLGVMMKSGYKKDKNGNYDARILNGDVDYLKFVIENQGYSFIEVIN